MLPRTAQLSTTEELYPHLTNTSQIEDALHSREIDSAEATNLLVNLFLSQGESDEIAEPHAETLVGDWIRAQPFHPLAARLLDAPNLEALANVWEEVRLLPANILTGEQTKSLFRIMRERRKLYISLGQTIQSPPPTPTPTPTITPTPTPTPTPTQEGVYGEVAGAGQPTVTGGDMSVDDYLALIAKAMSQEELKQISQRFEASFWQDPEKRELLGALGNRQATIIEENVAGLISQISVAADTDALDLLRANIVSTKYSDVNKRKLYHAIAKRETDFRKEARVGGDTNGTFDRIRQLLDSDSSRQALSDARDQLIRHFNIDESGWDPDIIAEANSSPAARLRIRNDFLIEAGEEADDWLNTNYEERYKGSTFFFQQEEEQEPTTTTTATSQFEFPIGPETTARQSFVEGLSDPQAYNLWTQTLPAYQRGILGKAPRPGTSSVYDRFLQLYNITGVGIPQVDAVQEETDLEFDTLVRATPFLDWMKGRGQKGLPTGQELRGGLSQLQQELIAHEKTLGGDIPIAPTGVLGQYARTESTTPIEDIKRIFEINLAPILAETAPGFRNAMRSVYTPFLNRALKEAAIGLDVPDPMEFLRQVMAQTGGQGFGKAFRPQDVKLQLPL
jgi:hypothetical protein